MTARLTDAPTRMKRYQWICVLCGQPHAVLIHECDRWVTMRMVNRYPAVFCPNADAGTC